MIGAVLAAASGLAGLLVTVPMASPAAAAPVINPQAVGQVGFSGHAGLYGWGAATLPDGDVLIGDYWNMRVLKYPKAGGDPTVFIQNEGFGPGQHQAPYGLAVDKVRGYVYMADTDLYKVNQYDLNGTWIKSFGTQCTTSPCPSTAWRYPSRVAIASDGTVFVVDTWDNHISAVDPATGVELYRWGSAGTGSGQFKQPHGADFDSNDDLYIADTLNKRVQVWHIDVTQHTSAAATFVRYIGSAGALNGQFKGDMRGLAIDKANDRLYVVDAFANRVNAYVASTGVPLQRWGTAGQGDGQFYDGGRELTVDGDGNVWVGDMPNFRVQKFQGATPGVPTSEVGAFLGAFAPPPGRPPLGGLNSPRGVTVDPSGNTYIVDTYNQRIQKYAPDGTPLAQFGLRGGGDADFSYPRQIAYSAVDDTLVVADAGNYAIKKFTASDGAAGPVGTVVWSVGKQGASGLQVFNQPSGVAVDAAGLVYVADTNNGRIVVLNRDGTGLKQISSKGTASSQLGFPRSIAVDPDGSIWVTDPPRHKVLHFNAGTGAWINSIGKVTSGVQMFGSPWGVVATADHLYVTDAETHEIKVTTKTSTGTLVKVAGGIGSTLGKLQQPNGDALGPDGRLYVAEQRNDRVSVWQMISTGAPVTVTGASPALGQGATGRVVTITGTGFAAGANVVFSGTGLTPSGVTVVSDTEVRVTLAVGTGAATGPRDVTVTNTDGGSGTCTGCFTVNPKPALTVSPAITRGQGATQQLLTLPGSGIQTGATLAFGSGVTVNAYGASTSTSIDVTVTVSGTATLGGRTITITNPDGGKATCVNCFVVAAKPTIGSVAPSAVQRGGTAAVVISGQGFQPGATVNLGGGTTASDVTVVSTTRIEATVAVDATAAKGTKTVSVVNPDAGKGTCTCFSVG